MRQELLKIFLTAFISAIIAALQAYLIQLTGQHIPTGNEVVAAMYGGVIATTRAIKFA